MKSQILDFEKPIVELEQKLEEIKRHVHGKDIDFDPEVRAMQEKIEATKKETYANLTAWQRVQIARHIARPLFSTTSSRPSPILLNSRETGASATTPRCRRTRANRRHESVWSSVSRRAVT